MKTILFLAAGTKKNTQLDLEKEASLIEQELKRLGRDEDFEFKVELAQTAEDLRHALIDHQPQLVHFAGHSSGSEGIQLGQQQAMSTETLEQYLAPHQNTVECVILNACFSAMQARAIVKHIPFVVGMNQSVAESAAIEQENMVALDILRLCAFLEADSIPEEILGVDDFELNEALHVLLKYSLLQRQTKNKILMMHRLVQQVLQDQMTEDEQCAWAEKAVQAVDKVFPYIEFENWATCERLLPCALV